MAFTATCGCDTRRKMNAINYLKLWGESMASVLLNSISKTNVDAVTHHIKLLCLDFMLSATSRGTVEPSGLLEDLLWSDPSPTCTGFKANVDRGCSFGECAFRNDR
ncbi:hypothetical protein ANCDUO_07653 [Ancylostoma duodenale]|uniref:Serine/threonine specific protein phosphatases domain-containing protein n=1 Tax=Ancylostoma duodenale TaxID=51022 RepID=A0A0C2DHW7_9BILA|nr:hypothetical protein ANCDUO_07653 [Ancylostoma duodenale]